MRLQVQGRVQTGVDTFDHSLGAVAIWQDAPGGPILVVNSGQQGGISTWRILPSGQVVGLDTLEYSPTGTRVALDHVVLAPFRGEMVAFYGLGTTTFWGQAIKADGSFGARRLVGFDTARNEIINGSAEFLQLWALMHPDAPPNLPDLPSWQGTTGLAQVGHDLVIISNDEASLRVVASTGESGLVGADLGIMAPTGLVVFGSEADARVVVAGAGGSSLSVLRATPQGYVSTDHRLDTGHTAFAQVQAVAGITVPTANGPLDLVLAGGGDHGVTLFALTRDGSLIWLDTVFDTALTGLHNVATLSASLVGGQVVITATSQRDAGITVLTLPLAGLGGIALAGQGDAGADIVIASPGVTTLTGGDGADVFVIQPLQSRITITDFTPGQDRLDLSAWPMLRDIRQVAFQPNAEGGVIRHRGHDVQIISANGGTLVLSDIFPRGLEGADRVMVLAPDTLFGTSAPPPPVNDEPRSFIGTDGPDLLHGSEEGEMLNGGTGNDTLRGDDGNDTIYGGLGNDNIGGGAGNDQIFGMADANTIWGGSGNDTIQGGTGNDTIYGGGGGTNRLLGNDGDDLILAGSGGDFIGGGVGRDTVRGGTGSDTIYGGLGDDNIGGGAGNDQIFGAAGANTIWGGLGNDTVQGGTGNDTIYGGGDGTNALFGNDGDDLIFAGIGGDFIGGGAGNDTVRGSEGNDTIYGGLGNDDLAGGAGNDVIFAATGTNTIWGGLGDDTIHAGTGRDGMNGGPGADTFVFASAAHIGIRAARDVITDFTSGVDKIDLSALNTTFNGTAGLLGAGQASFYYFAAGGLLIGDQNGNGAADWVIALTGAPNVAAGDFLL